VRLAKSGDRMAVTPNLSTGLTASSADDDDDGDDEAALTGDDATSSRGTAAEGLTDPGAPAPVVHIPDCSPSGDGVDAAVW